jgi:hypothetical protein
MLEIDQNSSIYVTGSWDGSAVRPMDRGKFCNRASAVWIRVGLASFRVAILMD